MNYKHNTKSFTYAEFLLLIFIFVNKNLLENVTRNVQEM